MATSHLIYPQTASSISRDQCPKGFDDVLPQVKSNPLKSLPNDACAQFRLALDGYGKKTSSLYDKALNNIHLVINLLVFIVKYKSL